PYAAVGSAEYPHVLSTYRLTEHHLSGVMSRWLPWLAELMPELFCEISPEHAAEIGVGNTDWVQVSTPRGSIRAKALVTRPPQPAPGPPGTSRVALPLLSRNSYHPTGSLPDVNWQHVKFIHQFSPDPHRTQAAWLMMSDVCKHCVDAPCLEVCPTGAILRTEFDTVYIQEDVCNGCRDCVAACPFGVIHMSGVENTGKGTAKKCTLCYDRLQNNLVPACAQACPTESIQFGPIDELKKRADTRLQQLQSQGFTKAQL